MVKRILVRCPGGHEALELIEDPEQTVQRGQARVRVRAIGVNYADVIVRMGYYEAAKGRYPITPGFEFSGIVDSVAPDVKTVKEGDKVFGITRFGAYASSIAVEPGQIWPCPAGWDFPDCAAFPAVFLTAYHALFKAARVEPGETLLVHSAAGGVGGALLQLGRIAGCRSVAVVGAAQKEALCRELGAHAVIDRSAQDLWKEAEKAAPGGFDAIFDANGVTTVKAGFDHLALGGRMVVYGFSEIFPRGKDKPGLPRLAWNYFKVPKFSPLDMTATNRSLIGFNVVFLYDKIELAARYLAVMLQWIQEGKIRKTPLQMFPLERVADAHKAIESGMTVGKLVLTV